MSKVTLKIEVDEEAYKIIMNTSVIANEEMLLKGSAKDLKMTEAMLKFIDAIHETTPLTESDDAVSRQEAIHCVTETELYNETFAEAKMRIAELKPVLPKREQGEWISVNPMVDTLMCSECGENIISEEFKSNYCPNCGAEMR